MSIQILTILFVSLTFVLYVVIAWRSRARSTKEFYIAGGGVSPMANAMATAADMMSVSTMLSVPGLIGYLGYDAAVYIIGPIGGFVLLGVLIAPYLRKFGKFTIPDFIGDRYYSNSARTIALVITVCITVTYLAGQMRGVGVVFSHFLKVDIVTGVLIGALIVMAYAVLGGMKGITYTQVAQFCILSFAFLVPIIFMSILLTDKSFIFTSYGSTLADGSHFLDNLDKLNAEFGFKEFTDMQRPKIDAFCIAGTLMFGTAALPHILVRYFTVAKVSAARYSVSWTLLFITIVLIATPPLSAFSRTFIMEQINGQVYADLPAWFSSWERTGLLVFNDLNGDGIVQYLGGAGNELNLDFDITFLAVPEIADLPNWIVALVAAGALAAALSTAAGLLLVLSSAVSHDLIKKQLRPDMSDKNELRIARICIAISIGIGVYFGINPPGFIIETVALAFSMAAGAFFPVLLLGIFNKKVSKEAGISGMLTGFLFALFYIIYFQFMDGKEAQDGYWMDISAQGIGIVAMILNFMVTLGVNRFFDPPSQEIQDMVEDMRIPV
ncbi:MAG: cation/acetate symporter [Saprospiraceae bacterium]|jgi:cation/acetate symporter